MQEGAEPKLREFKGAKSGTGTILVDINGKQEEFVTTTEVQTSHGHKSDDKEVQKFLDSVEGKVVQTAVLRLIAGNLYVSLDAYGAINEFGPNMMGDSRTSFEVAFTLDPKTLELRPGSREISYQPVGVSVLATPTTSDFELKLDSVTKLPGGSLALKGSFSGNLSEDMKGNKIEKPFAVKGTFDILKASGNDAVGDLLRGK